jgi:TonB family protein
VLEKGRVKDGLRDSVWLSIVGDTVLYKEIYKNGLFQSGTRYDKGMVSEYDKLETVPEYNGGIDALIYDIGHALRYPPDARKRRAQGQVFIAFVVYEDGTPHELEVYKAVDPDLDREALRVVSAMKGWIPGKLRGKSARVRKVLPLTFKLAY